MYKFGVLLVSLLTFATINAQETEEDRVRATFEGYRTAILNDRGEEAMHFLDRRSFEFYASSLEHIRYSDSATVANLRIIDQMIVLRMRHVNTKEEIQALTDSSFIVYAVDEGLIGKEGVSNLQIGTVTINDDFALGAVISGGEETPLNFHFYREDGEWGLDLTPTIRMGEVIMQQTIQESGMEELDFLYLLLEVLTGKTVDDHSVWQPIVPTDRKGGKSR